MSDADFEFRLERMFADAPALADAELFRAQVMDRLDRGWSARRFVIGAMGAAGGVVAAGQLVGVGGFGRLAALSAQSTAFIDQHLSETLPPGLSLGGVGLDVQTLVMIGALVLAAAGFGLVRLIREI